MHLTSLRLFLLASSFFCLLSPPSVAYAASLLGAGSCVGSASGGSCSAGWIATEETLISLCTTSSLLSLVSDGSQPLDIVQVTRHASQQCRGGLAPSAESSSQQSVLEAVTGLLAKAAQVIHTARPAAAVGSASEQEAAAKLLSEQALLLAELQQRVVAVDREAAQRHRDLQWELQQGMEGAAAKVSPMIEEALLAADLRSTGLLGEAEARLRQSQDSLRDAMALLTASSSAALAAAAAAMEQYQQSEAVRQSEAQSRLMELSVQQARAERLWADAAFDIQANASQAKAQLSATLADLDTRLLQTSDTHSQQLAALSESVASLSSSHQQEALACRLQSEQTAAELNASLARGAQEACQASAATAAVLASLQLSTAESLSTLSSGAAAVAADVQDLRQQLRGTGSELEAARRQTEAHSRLLQEHAERAAAMQAQTSTSLEALVEDAR